MKSFTIKDFIRYNNPCKICNSKVEFTLKYTSENKVNSILPTVDGTLLIFDLINRYHSNLQLIVDAVKNKFSIKSQSYGAYSMFKDFYEDTRIWSCIVCSGCKTTVSSDFFIIEENRIKPLTLFDETVRVQTDTHTFGIFSSYSTDKSVVVADINGKTGGDFNFELPLLPLSDFKNRESVIKKLNMILAFS